MSNRIKFMDIVKEQEEKTKLIAERHPRVQKIWLRSIGALFLAVCISVIFFTVRGNLEAKTLAEELKAQEVIAREKQRDIQLAQNAEMERRERETVLIAKLMGGLKGFVENYGYSSDDLITYAECPLNRVLNPAYVCSTIEEAILQPSQWVGFNESNEVTQENYKLARWVVTDFYTNPFRICSNEYCWAELNKDGCYLKKEVELNPYSRTWRYSSNG